MQDNLMLPAMQPFVKLIQSNMALVTQFSMSPEVLAQAMSGTQSMLQQGQQTAGSLAQSNAFAQLVQGLVKNYTEFMVELGQSGAAMLAQGQAAMVQQAADATESVGAATDSRGRRSRS